MLRQSLGDTYFYYLSGRAWLSLSPPSKVLERTTELWDEVDLPTLIALIDEVPKALTRILREVAHHSKWHPVLHELLEHLPSELGLQVEELRHDILFVQDDLIEALII